MTTLFRRSVIASALLGLVTVACGDDGGGTPEGGSGAPGGGGDTPGNGGSGGGGNTSESDVECTGEFARVMAPYTPNTSIEDWGGFLADEQGLVFSVLEDTTQGSDAEGDYPSLLITSDLEGNLATIHTYDATAMPGPIFARGADIYFVSGFINRNILRIPRSGGEATPLIDERLWAGPVSDGDLLYYAARPGFDSAASVGDAGVYSFDPETGTSTLLSDQGDTEIGAIDLDRGTLYWVETDGILSDADYTLFSMPASGGTPEMIMTLPNGTALGNFRVVDEVAFGNTITEDFGIEIHRTPFGQTPEVVEDSGGFPMLIANSSIYYGSTSGGVSKNSLAFDNPSVVAGTSGNAISSLAMGPTDLWYSVGPCIYRAPQ